MEPKFPNQGQVCHLIGSLVPNDDQNAAFLQIDFLDERDQIGSRMAITDNLRPEILHVHTIYVRELKSAYEYAHEHQLKDFNILIVEKARPLGEHARRYNAPCKKIAILMSNEPYGHRHIIFFSKSNQLKRICELHPAYDTLQYPLLFPTGNDGWSLHLKATKKVSQLQLYRWHFLTRPGNFAKIETERLQYLRREQSALRADNYKELHDAIVAGDGDPRNVGQKVFLPATFTGVPRYLYERQQGAMSYAH